MGFSERIQPLLDDAVEEGVLAGVTVTVESTGGQRLAASAGHWELDGGGPAYHAETPLRIASMTKAVTSVAAMQLVERGLVDLDEPVSRWLPELEAPMVLEADGSLRPARTPITARQLLTHTAGFGYDIWSERLAAYLEAHPPEDQGRGADFLYAPLVFEPGTQWLYSIATDWLGELVAEVSGASLGETLAVNVFEPLGMASTGFALSTETATQHARQADDSLMARSTLERRGGAYESGGGGLISTAHDYGRFLRMLLGRGQLEGTRILEEATVEEMARPQTGDLERVGVLESVDPGLSRSDDLSYGHAAAHGLGFLVTLETSRTGRTAGSLSWGGLFNTYYWIDLERDVAGALYTQVLPFLDRPTLDLHREFERTVYEVLDEEPS